MSTKTILVPTDFSSGAQTALACASELAKSLGASLAIVHVELAPVLNSDFDDEDNPQERQEHQLLNQVKPTSEAIGFERTFLKGNVVEEILNFAQQIAADTIVMGTHGQTNSPHVVLGTVAEAVLRQATCKVITVKPPS